MSKKLVARMVLVPTAVISCLTLSTGAANANIRCPDGWHYVNGDCRKLSCPPTGQICP